MSNTQPLIKWPGGKSTEFVQIKELIPKFNRYIEPFFGGGAVYFNLHPKKAIINDICEELIEFYRFVKGENDKLEFKSCMYEYVENWEKIPQYISNFKDDFIVIYDKYKKNEISKIDIALIIKEKLETNEDQFNGLFTKEFSLDPKNLLAEIIKNLISKISRTKKIEQERGTLPDGDLYKNIETAFRSGFYMHFRDVMNKNGTKYKISSAKKIANYYFVREFCYGAMFRFNSNGHFNIPYGGIAYNQKNFRGKVDYIFSQEVEELFSNTEIYNDDFEKILLRNDISSDDFIFLDPPYDSDFSNYEKKTFGKNDQARLSNLLVSTKGKFILIIKKTDFIFSLYNNKKGIKVDSFEKKYLYNVKGRNDREVEHLVIYNF